tara:strand:+ start:625 stop:876 length:252 start_codon:yes stop_codon:yes gene_type:complete
MFEKQKKSINALVDVSESMLNAMEQHGVDPETVANKPEFSVLVHFLKSIIDGELNIPNELTDKIRSVSEELGLDLGDIKKRLH